MEKQWIADALRRVGMEKLLKCQEDSAVHNPYWDTPTETTNVFWGITESFGNDPGVMAELIAGIKTVSRDPDYSWTALYYLNEVLRQPRYFGDVFDLRAFAADVLNNVRQHEQHLRQLKRWAGGHDASGCWSSAEGMIRQIEKYHPNNAL